MPNATDNGNGFIPKNGTIYHPHNVLITYAWIADPTNINTGNPAIANTAMAATAVCLSFFVKIPVVSIKTLLHIKLD